MLASARKNEGRITIQDENLEKVTELQLDELNHSRTYDIKVYVYTRGLVKTETQLY